MQSRRNRQTAPIAATIETLENRILLSGDGRLGVTLPDIIDQTDVEERSHTRRGSSSVNHVVQAQTEFTTEITTETSTYTYQAVITAEVRLRGFTTAQVHTSTVAHIDGRPLDRIPLEQGGEIRSGRIEYLNADATTHITGRGMAHFVYEVSVSIHEIENYTVDHSLATSDFTVENIVRAESSGVIDARGNFDIWINASALKEYLKAGTINDMSGKLESSLTDTFIHASGGMILLTNNASTQASDHYYGWRDYVDGPYLEENDWYGATGQNRTHASLRNGFITSGASAIHLEETATRTNSPEWDWYRDYHSVAVSYTVVEANRSLTRITYDTYAANRDYQRQQQGQISYYFGKPQTKTLTKESFAENPGSSPAATEESQQYAREQFDSVFSQFPSTLANELSAL